jgi:hypothetical protein
MITNMKAKLVYHVKEYHADGSMEEIKIWEVPRSKDKPHSLKYSFAYIVEGERIVGYDNAEGKGITGTSKGGNPLMNSEAWRNCGKILGRTFKE